MIDLTLCGLTRIANRAQQVAYRSFSDALRAQYTFCYEDSNDLVLTGDRVQRERKRMTYELERCERCGHRIAYYPWPFSWRNGLCPKCSHDLDLMYSSYLSIPYDGWEKQSNGVPGWKRIDNTRQILNFLQACL